MKTALNQAGAAFRRLYSDRTDDEMRYIRWMLRLLTFLVYAGMSIALLIVSAGKNPCYVQSTYKQEFLTKVVANPFYSSSQIVKQGPRSNYEVSQKFALPYKQQASDIGIFPVIPLDPLRHSSFWPVEPVPTGQLVAGGLVNLPPRDMVDGIYYYDEEKKQVFAKGVPSAGGTGPILASMALQSISGPIKVGSVLPNIARCIKPIPRQDPQPSHVEQWLSALKRIASNSHLRGTCLLTGQQATVDVTSNYKTSLTIFSSVNLLFMLTVVLWISASFALFYVGGTPQTESRSSEVSSSGNWTSADFFMLTGILWNIFLVLYILVPNVQDGSNIPLNNVVVAMVALLSAIAVQWHWAYYSGRNYIFFPRVTGIVEGIIVNKVDDSGRPSAPPLDTMPASSDEEEQQQQSTDGIFFNTKNFLSVASSVQRTKMSRLSMMALPEARYQKLGLPFAHENYYRGIKAQMHLDTVQNMEFAITTPLMSAVLLASFSPTVPTGMVQLLYLILLCSHIICIPALYMSNMCKRLQEDYPDYAHTTSMAMATYVLLGTCYILQINAIVIKLTFFGQLWNSLYSVDNLLQATTIMMVTLQIIFLLVVLAHATSNVATSQEWHSTTVARWAARSYVTLNFLLKFVVGWLVFSTALNKAFPAYACGIWGSV